jgi:hypothetical protein
MGGFAGFDGVEGDEGVGDARRSILDARPLMLHAG